MVSETADSVRACVSQPLRGQGGQVIGSLGLLWPSPREFSPGELDGFAWTAEITQTALDRVRLAQREHRIDAIEVRVFSGPGQSAGRRVRFDPA